MKKYFSKENIMIVLIIALFIHNLYLQKQIDKAIDYASDAYYSADSADDNASDALSYASDAADYAREAAENSFGNQCYSCP